jgi:hypothetical protein
MRELTLERIQRRGGPHDKEFFDAFREYLT